MSSQPTQLSKPPELPKSTASRDRLPEFEKQQQTKSVLDEPWRVTMLPDDEVPTIAVPSPDAEPPRKSLPWKPGDVARLRDDSPEGMMRYIATHTTGWWQEMAERALRDTEKAERMAEEAGWQPGQYWTLEPDVEAKEKMRAQEEARRQRDEQERAKEQAEKEAFARRQMELLKKAGRAPRCEYLYTDGRSCRAPQVRGEHWCHGHAKMMSYRPEKLELLPMEDEQAVTVNLYRVTRSLLSGRITEKVAGLMLWSVAIAAPGVKRIARDRRDRKGNTYHGDTEARRKAKNDLPQMNADGRRSHRRSSRESTRKKALQNRAIARDRRDAPAARSRSFDSHPGVTLRNSFRSGVAQGVPQSPKTTASRGPRFHELVRACGTNRRADALKGTCYNRNWSPGLQQRHISSQRYCPVCRGRGQREQRTVCPACYGEGHFNEAKLLRDANPYFGLRNAGSLSDFLKSAIDVSSSDFGNIQLFNSVDGTLRIASHHGFQKEFLDFFRVVKGSHCGCGAAMSKMSRVVIHDVTSDPIFKGDKSEAIMLRANARACQSTPLVGSSGQLLGMLSTHYRQPRNLSRNELNAIDEVTRELTISMEEQLRRCIV